MHIDHDIDFNNIYTKWHRQFYIESNFIFSELTVSARMPRFTPPIMENTTVLVGEPAFFRCHVISRIHQPLLQVRMSATADEIALYNLRLQTCVQKAQKANKPKRQKSQTKCKHNHQNKYMSHIPVPGRAIPGRHQSGWTQVERSNNFFQKAQKANKTNPRQKKANQMQTKAPKQILYVTYSKQNK